MTEEKQTHPVRIRRALISVSDKTDIVEFARELKRFGVEIISTGGTAQTLREAGLAVREVSDVTRFPEMMDGRIKTLHPRVHGGLLAVRDNPEHVAAMKEHDIEPIDMVVVNLYPFEETIARDGVTLAEAIEQIDIGGPAMVRSAAKNFRDVTVVVSPSTYPDLMAEMQRSTGALSLGTRFRLACEAFNRTSLYDSAVFQYLASRSLADQPAEVGADKAEVGNTFVITETSKSVFDHLELNLHKISDLRYGENPHQIGALFDSQQPGGIAHAELLSGKEMSFNNYVDADAAWQLVSDFDDLACAIIKHTNPAGVALGASNEEAYRKALACDPVSAFGGIVAFNHKVDEAAARAVTEIFSEVIIAPDYEPAAIEVFKTKKNLRVLRAGHPESGGGIEFKQISGGMLVQTSDAHRLKREDLKVVTKRQPTDAEIDDLLFAWTVCKHTKSNAIVYVRDRQSVGVGAGQMSRVDSVKIGAMRAQLPVIGSVLASDAFFPFRDGLDEAARHGITAVIQPGGSVRDTEVIAAADEHNLAMVFTGIRHFKH
ncbi:MAG: phosphoribosylaminoimidazolecarboxamide formyltransferase / cyclohydrolase [Blastocatellia bacterium]|jgi:phosphoribosylaminoimidazolecarboxamide formyltransferase/IMP cyclohydrolase|nr:phosphoribosylaminoimidazolecarboxamide formyltransferase / cyclohydrolase [Blastocatellia bacterium]